MSIQAAYQTLAPQKQFYNLNSVYTRAPRSTTRGESDETTENESESDSDISESDAESEVDSQTEQESGSESESDLEDLDNSEDHFKPDPNQGPVLIKNPNYPPYLDLRKAIHPYLTPPLRDKMIDQNNAQELQKIVVDNLFRLDTITKGLNDLGGDEFHQFMKQKLHINLTNTSDSSDQDDLPKWHSQFSSSNPKIRAEMDDHDVSQLGKGFTMGLVLATFEVSMADIEQNIPPELRMEKVPNSKGPNFNGQQQNGPVAGSKLNGQSSTQSYWQNTEVNLGKLNHLFSKSGKYPAVVRYSHTVASGVDLMRIAVKVKTDTNLDSVVNVNKGASGPGNYYQNSSYQYHHDQNHQKFDQRNPAHLQLLDQEVQSDGITGWLTVSDFLATETGHVFPLENFNSLRAFIYLTDMTTQSGSGSFFTSNPFASMNYAKRVWSLMSSPITMTKMGYQGLKVIGLKSQVQETSVLAKDYYSMTSYAMAGRSVFKFKFEQTSLKEGDFGYEAEVGQDEMDIVSESEELLSMQKGCFGGRCFNKKKVLNSNDTDSLSRLNTEVTQEYQGYQDSDQVIQSDMPSLVMQAGKPCRHAQRFLKRYQEEQKNHRNLNQKTYSSEDERSAMRTHLYSSKRNPHFRERMVRQLERILATREVVYDMKIQFSTSESDDAVNDPSNQWHHNWYRVGKLRILKQRVGRQALINQGQQQSQTSTIGSVTPEPLYHNHWNLPPLQYADNQGVNPIFQHILPSSKVLSFNIGRTLFTPVGDINLFRQFLYPEYDAKLQSSYLLNSRSGNSGKETDSDSEWIVSKEQKEIFPITVPWGRYIGGRPLGCPWGKIIGAFGR